jgi:hypothetical protein
MRGRVARLVAALLVLFGVSLSWVSVNAANAQSSWSWSSTTFVYVNSETYQVSAQAPTPSGGRQLGAVSYSSSGCSIDSATGSFSYVGIGTCSITATYPIEKPIRERGEITGWEPDGSTSDTVTVAITARPSTTTWSLTGTFTDETPLGATNFFSASVDP